MFVDPHDAGPDDESAVQDTLEYLESLPQLAGNDTFSFACHPEVSCFNACCRDLNMPLSPYDVLRLRQGLGMDSTTFIIEYTVIEQYPYSGFPVLFLKMTDSIEQDCPFLSEEGCSVYENRCPLR
jgi:Fe-S-cluster containining protein